VTTLLFKDGKRAFNSASLKDRRAKVVKSLEVFGGFERLITSD